MLFRNNNNGSMISVEFTVVGSICFSKQKYNYKVRFYFWTLLPQFLPQFAIEIIFMMILTGHMCGHSLKKCFLMNKV